MDVLAPRVRVVPARASPTHVTDNELRCDGLQDVRVQMPGIEGKDEKFWVLKVELSHLVISGSYSRRLRLFTHHVHLRGLEISALISGPNA